VVPAPLPVNEAARLDALRRYRILDSQPEQAFDDLTALAAQICGTPVALVSFVDETRQWFKSAHGLSTTETPRDIALCAHAILQADDFLVVPDTHADARFAGGPLVVDGPRIRGYAAAVLRDGDHHALGALCVIDHQPLSLSAQQQDALRRLARQVMAQLALRETAARLEADLARRAQIEDQLAAKERLYRGLVDNALGLICTHDLDGTLRMVNAGATQLLGYTSEEMVGRNLRDFIPEKYRSEYESYLKSLVETPQFNGLLSLTGRDGRQVAMAFQNFRFESPEGAYVVGHGVDVTERARVDSMNRRFAAVLDATTDGVALVDANLRPVYLNRSAREMVGVGATEDITKVDFLASYSPGAASATIKAGIATALSGGSWEGENTLRHRDGRELTVSQVVLAPRNAAGALEFIATISRDVTERKRAEESLRQAREDAVTASRLKSEFVANMSHEIRTPINGVVGLTSLLLETSLTAEQREYADGVTQSAEALLALVNDVLDLSKIEAGKLVLDPFEFELKATITSALAPVNVKANKKGLTIDVRFATELPEWVVGDPLRIRQVLINLLDNAIKFTERGTILVDVETVAVNGAPQIRFSVTDCGIGIPADRLSSIFETFTQADVSTTRRFGGSGLGLAICRQLSSMMRGALDVQSTVGRGSTFSFTVPLTAVANAGDAEMAPASTAKPAEVPVRALHVLVVEDNRINQTVAVRRLEKAGCTTEVVENGAEAVKRVGERSFDVVLMDCQMPVMDGYEATRRIRRMPEHARLPIIAMTANAMEGDREKCLAAGMSEYLTKPLQPAALIAMLDQLRDTAAAETVAMSEAGGQETAFDEASVRALFDDDVDAILALIEMVCTDLPGYAAQLVCYVHDEQWPDVARVAHTIKGAASNVSATVAVQAAAATEKAARSGDLATARMSSRALSAALASLVELLTEWAHRLQSERKADAA
jgi:PAS domain S-box-containing protein